MNGTAKAAAAAALLSVLCVLLLFSWLALEEAFPAFHFAPARFLDQLLPLGTLGGIAEGVSRFLWERRGLDLLMQAFVIIATVVCCMAMLKPGRGE